GADGELRRRPRRDGRVARVEHDGEVGRGRPGHAVALRVRPLELYRPALVSRGDGALRAVADVADLAVLALRIVPGERRRVVLGQAHVGVGGGLDQLVRGDRGGVVEPAPRGPAPKLAAVAGDVGDGAVEDGRGAVLDGAVVGAELLAALGGA